MIDGLDTLPPLGRFVASLLALDADNNDAAHITALTITMPVEFDIFTPGGRVLALGAAPPTQRIETSVLPVFHRLSVTLVADEMEGEDADAGT